MTRHVLIATTNAALCSRLTELAARQDATVLVPHTFADLVFSDAVMLVVDPDCLPAEEWQTYLDYLHEQGEEDTTPLVLLTRQETILPAAIAAKPPGTVLVRQDDGVESITELMEEVLLGTRNQWCTPPLTGTAPGMLEVEQCYIQAHHAERYVVVVARPDNGGLACYQELAERAGIEALDWAASAFLVFTFPTAEMARRFAATCVPAGLASLYAWGKHQGFNC